MYTQQTVMIIASTAYSGSVSYMHGWELTPKDDVTAY